MSTTPREALKTEIDPMRFSVQELEFLLEDGNYRKTAAVALANGIPSKYVTVSEVTTPEGLIARNTVNTVNEVAITEALDKIQTVVSLESASRLMGKFCGYDKIERRLKRALEYHQRRAVAKEMNPEVGHPSMYSRDALGREHYGGVGSDSERVVTWIDSKGKRHRYAFDLIEHSAAGGASDWARMDADDDEVVTEPVGPEGHEHLKLLVNDEDRYVQCPVCKHTETWKEGSVGSRNMARARMARHCKSAKEEVESHRLLAKEEWE